MLPFLYVSFFFFFSCCLTKHTTSPIIEERAWDSACLHIFAFSLHGTEISLPVTLPGTLIKPSEKLPARSVRLVLGPGKHFAQARLLASTFLQ